MDVQGSIRKYGVYIAGGVLLLYLVLKNAASGRAGAVAAANPNALELAKLKASGDAAAGQLGLEQSRLQAQLEAERIRAQAAANAAAQQTALRNRELDILSRQQSQGALNAILNGIGNVLKGATGQTSSRPSTSGSGGSGGVFTPTTFPNRPQALPSPVAPNLGPDIYNPPYSPSYPEIDASNLPPFEPPGTTFDSGYTFSDQGGNIGIGSDFNYGMGDYFSDPYSALPDFSPSYVEDFAGFYDVPVYGPDAYGGGGGAEYDPYSDYGGGDVYA